ncbi:unnamed protein product [Cyclocybe aegerita]|uniref:Uncharacterized protein n=1 Tax=Cyclocybe aegerita TaxID=1973307 RepID=A0A8S0W8Q5_CYCAE|nr:unnamed protein product [Cyclocybe aegerita]
MSRAILRKQSKRDTLETIEDVRARIERLEKVVEDAVEAKSTVADVLERLKGAGATHKEAEDFGKQFIQLFKARHGSVEGPGSQQIEGEREGTPEGLNEDEAAEFRRKRDSLLGEQPQGDEEEAARRRRAVDAAEWQLVLAKLATVAARPDSSAGKGSFSELLKIFDRSSASTSRSIPSTVLDGAPHLWNLSSNAIKDPHLDETWRLRLLFAGKETIDSIVDHLQAQPVDQPLPRSIWRLLVQDQYVDFEKLFALMDPNYNHNDDPKDFGGGFALVKKELATAKKTLRTEADGIRVFAAWCEGTILLYPHRLKELQAYSRLVSDVFHACPNDPSNGIRFDLESRQRYAKSPYRLDDKAQSFVSILGQFLAIIGTWVSAVNRARTVGGMVSVVSVVVSTEQETSRRAMLLSKLAEEKELALAAQRAADLAAVGPKQFVKTDVNLKRPAAAPLDVPPRYRRGFVWSNSASLCESPAALLTLSAPPLPSPPSHLIDDPALISSLSAMQGFVKVDTPFNVDRLESLLSDHPNRPFVDSVIRGLREGFWPFEDGDWDKDATEPLSNFASEVEDLDAIRAFRDKELAAERWSDPLPITDLLPGMMSSPMFVAWQKEKPRVITDHSASGLNDGIPRTEAKVHYDDMRTFGQILFNARLNRARTVGGMVSVVSVVVSTEQETSRRAMLLSKLAEEKELALAAQRAADLAAVGFVKTDVNLKRPAAAPLDVPPRYRHGFVWSNSASLCESPAALLTLSAPPLPSPPSHLIDDPALISSLSAMQGFVKVDTPFNVDRLESLLSDHPNRPFVDSVIHLDAIRAFRDKELAAERWSDPLPITDLLPGMMSSPMFVAWQKEKPHVITDHSASGLNDGIPRTEAKVHFGQILFNARRQHRGQRLVVWKSDIASAFLNLPAHPLWQLQQIVVVDGKFYVRTRLLCWIAVKKLSIEGLLVYMDDSYGWDFADNLIKFSIGCPYEDRKQEDGDCLKIIGFWVDPNRGSISLPPDSVDTIVTHITSFLAHPKRSPILRDWQRLGGHLNWLFNVLPCGRPALSGLFRKIRGKTHSSSPVFLNRTVRKELTWLAGVIRHAIGVRFVDSLNWTDDKADIVLWTDASLRLALSFYYSGNGFVYQLRPPPPGTAIDIFFLELIAIMSAIFHVASFKSPPRRILLFTDSLDAVGLLNSLAASEDQHNAPLLGIAEVILTSGVDLRVRHIPGKDNIRADMLSRLLLEDFHRRFPADHVQLFDPPRVLLPARWRETLWLQASAIEKSTSQGYATGARDYLRFCITHSLPIKPTPQTLSCYIAYTSQFIASGPKYLSGARHFLADFYPEFDSSRSHPIVQATIRGSMKTRADPIRRKLPLRLEHLSAFLKIARDSKSYDNLLFITILSCCFYACHRSGELVQKNDSRLFDLRKIICRSSLIFVDGRAQYRLPYHKADRFYRGSDILHSSQDVADPVSLLKEYVILRNSIHGTNVALFLKEDGSHPTCSWFDAKFFAVLDRTFGGHSPRAGGATFYASLGVSEDVIQAIGRWSSAAWKIYVRENPTIRAELQLAALRLRHLYSPHPS